MARKSLENWMSVSFFLRHASSIGKKYGEINLHFRDGTDIDAVNDPHLALALLGYYYYSNLLDSCSYRDMLLLKSVGEDISKKMAMNFKTKDIEKGSTGGTFSFKEGILFALIRKYRPDAIIETGVAQGVSSYTILSALDANSKGELTSIDLPNRNPTHYNYYDGTVDRVFTPQELTPGWLIPDRLKTRWTLRLGKSEEILPMVDKTIEMFLHDSEHSYKNMTFEFDWAYLHLTNGGLLTSDDISWNMAFDDFIKKHSDMKRLLDDKQFGVAIKN